MSKQTSTWHHLTAAPHRSLFLVGALQGVMTMLWWVLELIGRYGVLGAPTVWSVAPTWAHAFLMIYGFLPLFIFGFLFTTYPNWMSGDKIKPSHYIATCLLITIGAVMFYAGLIIDQSIVVYGVATMLVGWCVAFYALQRVLMSAPGKDKRHAKVTSVALGFGCLGVAAYLLWLLTDNWSLLTFSRAAGIWFFLLPIVMTVSHRMIPFFSSKVLDNYVLVRPYWMLWVMLACSAGHGILQLLDALPYLWLVDFPLAICALYLSFTWGFLRSFSVSLLAVLHISFAWLSLSMLLYGTQSLMLLLSDDGIMPFGLAPLHALAIGYFASIVLGMASRVTIGHSGRPLVLDNFTWLLFLGFQTAAIARVLADTVPAIANYTNHFYLLAGLIWLACFAIWAARYAPIFWRERVDGKSG